MRNPKRTSAKNDMAVPGPDSDPGCLLPDAGYHDVVTRLHKTLR